MKERRSVTISKRKKNPSRLEVDVVEVVVHREISTTSERERERGGERGKRITITIAGPFDAFQRY